MVALLCAWPPSVPAQGVAHAMHGAGLEVLCVPEASCADLTSLLFLFRSPLEVLPTPYKALHRVD